jgi:hypothetical protein
MTTAAKDFARAFATMAAAYVVMGCSCLMGCNAWHYDVAREQAATIKRAEARGDLYRARMDECQAELEACRVGEAAQ